MFYFAISLGIAALGFAGYAVYQFDELNLVKGILAESEQANLNLQYLIEQKDTDIAFKQDEIDKLKASNASLRGWDTRRKGVK